MLKHLVLVLALATLCAAGGGPDAGGPPKNPPPEAKYKDSEVCTDKCDSTFETLAKMLGKKEPVEMPKCDPCAKCNVTLLKTIHLTKDKLVQIADDLVDDEKSDGKETMYYSMCMTFDQIKVSCCGCKAKDKTATDQEGCYAAVWSNAEVSVKCKKAPWDGDSLIVLTSKVNAEPKPNDPAIEYQCTEPVTDKWGETCKEAHESGAFNTLLLTACQTTFAAQANQNLEEDKQEKGSSEQALAKMMTCSSADKER